MQGQPGPLSQTLSQNKNTKSTLSKALRSFPSTADQSINKNPEHRHPSPRLARGPEDRAGTELGGKPSALRLLVQISVHLSTTVG